MFEQVKRLLAERFSPLSRRQLFQGAGLLPAALASASAAPAGGKGLEVGRDIYQSIGVRPLINCRGTLTIVGGSLELPEVRAAMDAAGQYFVHLDELAEGAGKRIAEITGAEWGVVTSGCAAGIAHATAACVAGANPDLHVRIPNLHGFPKNEVIIPKHSRNVYDAAVRSIGVQVLEVETPEQLEAALGPRTAMIYFFATERNETGPMSLEPIAAAANKRNVPVFVDAAAEVLTIPNVHLKKGAALVGYSGGKCLRGPQCAGVIIGRKDLTQAMWVHSAPHHGYGRSTKVGKEEAMGMLMALEMWTRRDHDAEWKQWRSWMDHIAARVRKVSGVSAEVRETRALSNRTPGLSIRWDSAQLGITGDEVATTLLAGEPRIALSPSGRGRGGAASTGNTGVSITAYMMNAGQEKIVADRLYQVLSAAKPGVSKATPAAPVAELTGRWNVHIDFLGGSSDHVLYLTQDGGRIAGTHQGDFIRRDLMGTVEGTSVRLRSAMDEGQMGDRLVYTFTGTASADSMSGDLDLGEYLKAKWTAKKHRYGAGGTA